MDAEHNVELEYKNTMTAKFVTAKSHLSTLRVCACLCVRTRSHLSGWCCCFLLPSSLDSADWRLRGDTAASAAPMKMDYLYSLRPAPPILFLLTLSRRTHFISEDEIQWRCNSFFTIDFVHLQNCRARQKEKKEKWGFSSCSDVRFMVVGCLECTCVADKVTIWWINTAEYRQYNFNPLFINVFIHSDQTGNMLRSPWGPQSCPGWEPGDLYPISLRQERALRGSGSRCL